MRLPWAHQASCPITVPWHVGCLRGITLPCLSVKMLMLQTLNIISRMRGMTTLNPDRPVLQDSFMALAWSIDHMCFTQPPTCASPLTCFCHWSLPELVSGLSLMPRSHVTSCVRFLMGTPRLGLTKMGTTFGITFYACAFIFVSDLCFKTTLQIVRLGRVGIALSFCPRHPVRLGLLRSLAAPCCYVTTTKRGM